MGRYGLAFSAFSLLLAVSVPGPGRAYTFIDVVNSAGPYGQFTPPSINAAGDVAFRANLDGGGTAIVTGNGSGTTLLADPSGPYTGFLTQVLINDAGTVVFHASRDTGEAGIYSGPDPMTDTVAEVGDMFLTVDLFGVNALGSVVFGGRLDSGPRGLFVGTGSVVDDSGPFQYFGTPDINDAGTVAFRGSLDSLVSGVYRTVSGFGALPIAESSGPYAAFDEFVSINESGTVAFTAPLDAGGSGVFVGPDPDTDTIADSSGPYESFQQPSIDDTGRVTFHAELDAGGSGIFTGPDPVADRVIGTGDTLFGATVYTASFFWHGSNAAGDVAFSYYLSNGLYGVAIATVPEPDAGIASLAAAALLLGLREQRRSGRGSR